jgi:formate-dependent nitrite reductase membrane component NrfD
MAEHFVQPPHWEWYIAGYFFLAGLAAGAYTLATLLRLSGRPADEDVIRLAYLSAFPLTIACAILLTIDLGQPLRFWHMMIDTTPGAGGINFKYWSPISLGTWALLVFGAFSVLSFIEALTGRIRVPLLVTAVGSIVALFLASYTGVVLSVSNQPVWSDSWAIGGLFVASAMSGSAALLLLFSKRTSGADETAARLEESERYFALLELALIAIFFITLASAGTLGKTLGMPWGMLWLLVIVSILPPFAGFVNRRGMRITSDGTVSLASERVAAIVPVAVIAGVFLLRVTVIFSAQF